jgi:hypothetical protein
MWWVVKNWNSRHLVTKLRSAGATQSLTETNNCLSSNLNHLPKPTLPSVLRPHIGSGGLVSNFNPVLDDRFQIATSERYLPSAISKTNGR